MRRTWGAALGRLGFEVTRLENADRASLWRGLQEFALAAAASKVAVVFYAGHGIEVDQRNFLVPVDARLASDQDVEFEAVPLGLVSRAVERASGLRLVILDACRENPFAVSMQRAGATRSIGRGLSRVEPSGETLVAYAAKEGTVAADGSGRNSPYSKALLAHLEEPGLEVGLMFRKVRDAVLASTGGRQEPHVYGSLSSRGVYLAAGPAPEPVPAGRPTVADASRDSAQREDRFWELVKDSGDPADIQVYLDRYPGGTYEVLARNRLKRMEGTAAEAGPSPSTADASSLSDRMAAARLSVEEKFWALVEESEEPGDIEAYLEQYPKGVYAPLARMRLSHLRRARAAAQERASPPAGPAPRDAVVEPPAAPDPARPVAPPSPESAEDALELKRSERRLVQQGLALLGFSPGPADGEFGPRTRLAIRAYREQKGLAEGEYLTAELSEALRELGAEARREERRRAELARVEAARAAELAREEAARAADDAAFARAKELDTRAGYEGYLARGGRHEPEARRRLAALAKLKAAGEVFRDCAGCPELVVVPSGSFMMGSPGHEGGRDGDEGPRHRVAIGEAFAVGVYEVTFGEWDACRGEGGCSHNPGDRGWGRGSRPVVGVSWEDAKEYVRWLSRKTGEGYRLLSESEWEYAARGGSTTRYWWGDAVGRGRANCDGCGSRWDDESTAPVGSFSPNGYGLHDVHGNVWERVEDCWHGSYVGAPGDGSAWTTGGKCGLRVRRGGSWYDYPRYVRSANRYRLDSGSRRNHVGFRVARTLD